jgi:hypothetical protein
MKKTLVVLGLVALALGIAVPAMAARARDITSGAIQNDTVRSEDICNSTIEMNDLSDGLKEG